MSVQENKTIAGRLFEELWNEGKLATLEEIDSPDCVSHDPFMREEIHGREGFEQYVVRFRTAFPDVHFTLESLIGEGDLVAARWSARGTFTGPLMGFEPTGKWGEVTGMTFLRFAEGKIVESWIQRDDLGMLQAMGVVPEFAAAHV